MVGLPSNQVSGTRPLNQAPIRRSCSGPEGGGELERRRPRWGPLVVPSSVILRDYMITQTEATSSTRQSPRVISRRPPTSSEQGQLESHVRRREAGPLVKAVG